MDGPAGVLSVLMFAGIVLGIIFAILMLLLPFFILRIRKELIEANRQIGWVLYYLKRQDDAQNARIKAAAEGTASASTQYGSGIHGRTGT